MADGSIMWAHHAVTRAVDSTRGRALQPWSYRTRTSRGRLLARRLYHFC
ncbi:hypothetical protein [Thermobaculum terrenum]|nr:hypothetical protein [Thermobaculum terrenum]